MIEDLDSLTDAVISTSHRDDLSAQIPGFIQLADAQIRRNIPEQWDASGIPDALSADNPTNELLSRHPDLYLYGAMLQLALWTQDDAMQGVYSNLFVSTMDQITRFNTRSNVPAREQLVIKRRAC